jgi:hypothetical protein
MKLLVFEKRVLASIKKYECKCDRVHSENAKSADRQGIQNVPQRYRHKPKIMFRINPTTRPICMRRLHRARKSLSAEHIKRREGGAHENTVLSGVSRACPLSQKAAGFGARRKKKGRSGKKKPMMMPLSTARARESLSADPPARHRHRRDRRSTAPRAPARAPRLQGG